MVAIVTGAGLGVENSSGWVLGSRGQLGSASFGRYGENVYVNAMTGNLMINRTDEVLIGQGPDDIIERSYNSLGDHSDDNGDNWQLNAQRHIDLNSLTGAIGTLGSTITLVDWDGSRDVYTSDASGVYSFTKGNGASDTITFTANVWTWKDGNSNIRDFYDNLNNGRITSTKDTDGNTLTYTYVGNLLTKITTADGEYTTLNWSGNNLTSIVTTLSGGATQTLVSYTYDSNNRLSTVTTDLTPDIATDGSTPNTSVTTTYYYDDSNGISDRVRKITQTGGAEIDISYDSSFRVSSISEFVSVGVARTTTFAYATSQNVTTTIILDAMGNTTTLLSNASKGYLKEIDLPPDHAGDTGQVIKYTYSSTTGDLLTATDGSGNKTTYTYDANGNLASQVDALGNTVTYTYDQTTNALLSETHYSAPYPTPTNSVSMTTWYAYDSENHLRYVVSPLGEVTQYDYNSVGQQSGSTVYRDNTYNVTGLQPTDTISESALNSWVAGISDRSTVERKTMFYDFRGNLTMTRSFSQAATDGTGLTSQAFTQVTYAYDQYGRLVSRFSNAATNIELFAYDGLGRLTSSTDLNGSTTNIQYIDGSNETIVAHSTGVTTTSYTNLAGELTSSTDAGSDIPTATIGYKYDILGNLRMVTDGSQRNTYYLYDAVGRKVADIAGNGSVTEYGYDASNRLVKTVHYTTALTLSQLSTLSTTFSTTVDSNGNPTNVLLSSIRPALSNDPNNPDQWEWRIYDKANRLIQTIDGTGGVTTFAYDGASNLLSTTSYYNKIAVTNFKTATPTILQSVTANTSYDNVTRYYYDLDGRVTETLDGKGYLTENIYDGAGETTQTISFFNLTDANRATDTVAQLLQSVGNGSDTRDIFTRYFYDGRGSLRYALDDNLRPTEYGYDWAGRLVHTFDYGSPITPPSGGYSLVNVQSQIAMQTLGSDPNTRKTWSIYDTATGQLVYSIDANGGVASYDYDPVRNVTTQVQYVTLLPTSYDLTQSYMISWVTAHSDANNDRVTRLVYDQENRLAYTVDAEGHVTEYDYDKAGRKVNERRYADVYPVDDTVNYHNLFQLISSTAQSAPPSVLGYTYDNGGWLTDSYDNGIQTHYAYDGVGRVISKTIAPNTSDAATVGYTYDAAGRLVSETQAPDVPAISSTTSYTYDGMGHLLTKVDGNLNTTTYTYDALGHILTITVPLNATTNAVTTNVYDAFGNLVKSTSPIGGVTYNFYDSLNRLVLQIDADNYATATTYTIGNAVASVTHYWTKITGTITVGVAPLPTQNTAEDATTTFTRDKLDRVTQVTDAEGFYEKYTLDAFGDRVIVWGKTATGDHTQLGGKTVNVFDQRGLLISETLPITSVQPDGLAHAVVNTYQYDSRGNRTQMVEAAGLIEQRTTTYVYDLLNRLTQTIGDSVLVVSPTNLTATSTVAAPATITSYDRRGNVTEIKDAAGNCTFFYYDDLNRKIAEVTSVTTQGTTVIGTLTCFGYDDNNNLTSQTVYGDFITIPGAPGATPPNPVNSNNCRKTTYTYDAGNRLTATTVYVPRTGYYDPVNGYTVSPANSTIGITITNTYDKAGNIIEQSTNTCDQSGNIIQENDGNQNNVWYYYDKLGRKTAQVDQDLYLTTYTLDPDGNVTKETRFATALSGPPGTTAPTQTSDPTNDRVTTFTYDRNGRRLTETRTGVIYDTLNSAHAPVQATGSSQIVYTYNGLGEILTKKEATLDTTSYTYDSEGRLITTTSPSFSDWTSTTSTPVTDTPVTNDYYDGLNNLTKTVQKGSAGAADRVTVYQYGYNNDSRLDNTQQNGGRLLSVTDASGFVRNYEYDVLGRTLMESFVRITNGTSITQANVWQYDKLGRMIYQSVATFNQSSGNWGVGDKNQITYDAYGEVIARGINGVYPETYTYDSAGRVIRSTADDGTVKLYVYNANGNQTLEITSDGNALPSGYDWSSITVDDAIKLLTNNGLATLGTVSVSGMVVTITAYDGRGQAIQTLEPRRQVSSDGSTPITATIVTGRSYNAFGEVVTQTDGNGNVTTFVYNTMGKILNQINPLVSYMDEQGRTHNQPQSDPTLGMKNPTQTNYYDISGRLIGVQDANGNTNTRTLLAGTGYGGGDPLVLKEFHADTGIFESKYDVFGEVKQEINEVGKTETYYYDAMGRLIQQTHQTRTAGSLGNATGADSTLIDYYAYDGLGERIKHWNNVYVDSNGNPTASDQMWYDMQGRLTCMNDMGGGITLYSYTWEDASTLTTSGMGAFGGWRKVTTGPATHIDSTTHLVTSNTETEDIDYFGRTVDKVDFGNHNYNYTFNAAGQLAAQTNSAGQNITYTYFNTGLLASESSTYSMNYGGGMSANETTTSNYRYDANSNRTYEGHSATGSLTMNGQTYNLSSTGQSAVVTWDAMNRMTQYTSTVTNQAPVTINWDYDLNSNIRHMKAQYGTIDAQGNISTTDTTTPQEYWYLYDSMNRFTVTKGTLVTPTDGSTPYIWQGESPDGASAGMLITYNKDGTRATMTQTSGYPSIPGWPTFDTKEYYYYSADGYLVQVNDPGSDGNEHIKVKYIRDSMGRVVEYHEYDTNQNTIYERYNIAYNSKSQETSEQDFVQRSDGQYWSTTTSDYYADANGDGVYGNTGDTYQGTVTHQHVTEYHVDNSNNVTWLPASDTVNAFEWWDAPLTSVVTYKPDANTTNTSRYYYDANGFLQSVRIQDGNPRTVSFTNNAQGEILQRDENPDNSTSEPKELHFYFNGMQVGDVSNNGTSDVDYVVSIAQHTAIPGNGVFRNGSTYATSYADFDQSYDPVNGYDYQSTASKYTVQAGDTLQSIAQALWGDSSFWYLLADANGMDGTETLPPGMDLVIPNKVHNIHNNSDTYKVYDPNVAVGDVSPTTPKAVAPPKHHNSACAILGAIIVVIIAVVVTYFSYGTLAPEAEAAASSAIAAAGASAATAATVGTAIGMFAAGAVAGALGSIVSQGAAMLMHMQKGLNWKAVGMSAITAALTMGAAPSGDLATDVINGVIGNAEAQGIELATGLEKKFDFADLATAGVTAGVGAELNGVNLHLGGANSYAAGAISGMAGAVVGASIATLKAGTDFGDNIMAQLPNVIGATVGNAIAANGGNIWDFVTGTGDDGYTVEVTRSDGLPVPIYPDAIPVSPAPNPPLDLKLFNLTLPDLSYASGSASGGDLQNTAVSASTVTMPAPKRATLLNEMMTSHDGTLTRTFNLQVQATDANHVLMTDPTTGAPMMVDVKTYEGNPVVLSQYAMPDGRTEYTANVYAADQQDTATGEGNNTVYFDNRADMATYIAANPTYVENPGHTDDYTRVTTMYAGSVDPGWPSGMIIGGYKFDNVGTNYDKVNSYMTNLKINSEVDYWHEYGHSVVGFGSDRPGENSARMFGAWKAGLYNGPVPSDWLPYRGVK